MPARILDGDALWRSDKLAQVMPPAYRAEYANMIPLALADGTFECNPRRVWADVYSYNRPEVTVDMVAEMLDSFEKVGLLVRIEKNGKVWGYWEGIEKRLPAESQRDRYKNGIGGEVKAANIRERCVYFLQDTESQFIKIGFCYFDRIRSRMKELQTGTPGRLKLMGVVRSARRELENDLHTKWAQYQTNSESEWFVNHHTIRRYIEEQTEDVDFTEDIQSQKPIENQSKTITTPDKIRLDLDNIREDKDGSEKVDATTLFGQAKRVYRRYVGKSMGSLGPRANQWQDLVTQHGELVLSAVEIWAQEGGKGLRNVGWPLAVFLKNADEFIDAAKQATEAVSEETKVADIEAASIEAAQIAHIADELELRAKRQEEEEVVARIAADPSAIGIV